MEFHRHDIFTVIPVVWTTQGRVETPSVWPQKYGRNHQSRESPQSWIKFTQSTTWLRIHSFHICCLSVTEEGAHRQIGLKLIEGLKSYHFWFYMKIVYLTLQCPGDLGYYLHDFSNRKHRFFEYQQCFFFHSRTSSRAKSSVRRQSNDPSGSDTRKDTIVRGLDHYAIGNEAYTVRLMAATA